MSRNANRESTKPAWAIGLLLLGFIVPYPQAVAC